MTLGMQNTFSTTDKLLPEQIKRRQTDGSVLQVSIVPGLMSKRHIFLYIYSNNILLKARELCEQQESESR